MLQNLTYAALMLTIAPSIITAGVPPLPEETTSFGAAVLDGQLYIYGGHTGPAHEYSTADQSGRFLRIDLEKGSAWQELTAGPKLQGLALVAHGGSVYRLGGFTAVNAEGEEHDLRSQAGVAVYDLKTDRWEDLSPLPEPRSSFDAAVLRDRVYIFGGWNLQGGSPGEWHTTAYSADLTKRPLVWEAVTTPPFQRRAVAVAAHADKLYVIGGMTPDGTTRRVDVYDVASKTWTTGPELAGERGIDGFGVAARSTSNGLFVSSLTGSLQRLDDDANGWSTVSTLQSPRFFHAMVPVADGLLLVGGANMSEGKIVESELVPLASAISKSGNR